MNNGKTIVLLILAALFICIFLNNDLASVNNMEARNYTTAREILQNGTWLVPTMNGELRLAKPPLPTWITALFMMGAGTDANIGVNRIPAGICGLLMALFTFLLVRRVSRSNERAVTAVLILVTGQLFFLSTRRNFWDIYTHTAMVGAIWAMMEIFMRKEGKALYFMLFALFMAFSFCSKGPISLGVMFIPFMASYLFLYGAEGLKENKWGLALGFAFAGLVAAIWPAYIYLTVPHDAVAVATAETANWFTIHTQAPWYYLINMLWIPGIWAPFFLYGVIAPFVQKDWSREEKLFLYWFILSLLILSIIPEKKVRYLLPEVVPGAVISAIAVLRLRESGGKAWKWVYGLFCFTSGILCLAGAGGLLYYSPGNLLLIPAAFALGAAGLVVMSHFLKKRTRNTHLAVVAALCLLLVSLMPVKSKLIPKDQTVEYLQIRQAPELKGRGFYFLGSPPEELVFAAGKVVRSIGTYSRTPAQETRYISALEKSDPMGVLMSEKPVVETYPGITLLRSIKTRHTTLYIYSFRENSPERG